MEPDSFEILSSIYNIKVVAAGSGVRARHHLRRKHGGSRWRKMKGFARVRESDGNVYEAEIHGFEAHGIGRCEWKIKALRESR